MSEEEKVVAPVEATAAEPTMEAVMHDPDAPVITMKKLLDLARATVTQGEYERMVEFIRPATEGWKTHAYKCSALTHDGLPELWAVMRKFEKDTKESGVFQKRRKAQLLSWVRGMIAEHLHNLFFNDPMIGSGSSPSRPSHRAVRRPY